MLKINISKRELFLTEKFEELYDDTFGEFEDTPSFEDAMSNREISPNEYDAAFEDFIGRMWDRFFPEYQEEALSDEECEILEEAFDGMNLRSFPAIKEQIARHWNGCYSEE